MFILKSNKKTLILLFTKIGDGKYTLAVNVPIDRQEIHVITIQMLYLDAFK